MQPSINALTATLKYAEEFYRRLPGATLLTYLYFLHIALCDSELQKITYKDLEEHFNQRRVPRQTNYSVIKKLITEGLVEKDITYGKIHRVFLTEEGRKLFKSMN